MRQMKIRESWKKLANKSSLIPPAAIMVCRYIGKNKLKKFVSGGIGIFGNERGEPCMASHAALVMDRLMIPFRIYKKAEKKWKKKGYDINRETVWVIESTMPRVRIAPLDIYMTPDYETLVFDWKGLSEIENESKTRSTIIKRAMERLGDRYPVENLFLFALNSITAKFGLRFGRKIAKKKLTVCSRLVGLSANIPQMRDIYGVAVEKYHGKRIMLDRNPGIDGSGIPITEATPDDFFDEAMRPDGMFDVLFSSYIKIL